MNFKITATVTDNDPDQDYVVDDLKYDLEVFLAEQNLEITSLIVEEVS